MKRNQNAATRRRRLLLILALTSIFATATHLHGQESSSSTDATSSQTTSRALVGARVGVSDFYKNGFQTRVVVETSDATTASVELETIDSDGVPFVLRRKLTDEERAARRVETTFLFPKSNGELAIRAFDDDEKILDERTLKPGDDDPVFRFPLPANPSRPTYLVLGSEKLGFQDAFAELRLKENRRPLIVATTDVNELPTDFRAYEAFDRMFLTTNDAEIYRDATAARRALQTVWRWTERGGNVVLLAGPNSIPLLSENGALEAFNPGKRVAEKTHEFRAVNALTTGLRNVKNLAMNGSRSNPYLRTPVVSELKSGTRVEMQEAETPLLVSRAVGLGSIAYFAADLSAPPISNWSGRGTLMLKILGAEDASTSTEAETNAFMRRGYVDVSGQARSALDAFQGARIVPFSLVAGLSFLYLLAIAPWDWFFAKKAIKRPRITWATFPLYVLIFSALAVALVARRTPKEPILNQADILDFDVESGIARGTSWFGFYSPYGERYDFSYKPRLSSETLTLEDCDAELSPLTLSSGGMGGAEQTTRMPREWSVPYRLEGADVKETPTAARSSKSFIGRWTGRASGLSTIPELVDDGLTLRGAVVNPFDAPIYSASIVYEGGAYFLGTLPPGVSSLERGAVKIDAKRALSESRSSTPTSDKKLRDFTTYNAGSKRLPYILRAASFYDVGGGVGTFGLEKRLQRDVDLSALIRCGRAVVYGTIVDPDCEDYQPTEEATRQALDAIEAERYNKKTALERGETYRSAKEETIEKYGLYGTTPEFAASDASFSTSRSSAETAPSVADKRFVVVRIVLPLKYGGTFGGAKNASTDAER